MTKKLIKSLAIAAVGSLLVAGSAMAIPSINFTGQYTLTDSNDADVFLDELTFQNVAVTGLGEADGLLDVNYASMFGTNFYAAVDFSPLFIDVNNPYEFNPTFYADGFTVTDLDGSAQKTGTYLQADLEVQELVITGSTGSINSIFQMNLTDIVAVGYTSGSSAFFDTMLAAPGGAMNVTLNLAGNLAGTIDNVGGSEGDSVASSMSGSAAPVPEPATMLLFGTGLAGLAGVSRRRKSKK